jgi:excisionase family DNA binding protein
MKNRNAKPAPALATPGNSSLATLAPTEEPFIGVEEGAALLAVPANTLYKWALARRVKSYKIGKLRRFRRSELLAFVAAHSVAAAE